MTAKTNRTPNPPPDPNVSGQFWTPVRSVDEEPPLSVHYGDDELLPSMPISENFRRQTIGDGLTRLPTGVREYRRIRLSTLFPQLEGVTLGVYYRLPRIRCCGYLALDYNGELHDCERCQNRGYVCPSCLGARWVEIYTPKPTAVPCPSCTWDNVYTVAREEAAVRAWLERHWPHGVVDNLASSG